MVAADSPQKCSEPDHEIKRRRLFVAVRNLLGSDAAATAAMQGTFPQPLDFPSRVDAADVFFSFFFSLF